MIGAGGAGEEVVLALPVASPVDDAALGLRRGAAAAELPLSVAEPMFDVPDEPSETEQIIEEASTWSRVWKPFLYESIGWFIGAFLILAGTFYGVALSWDDMSTANRALVVFAIAGGWSAGFAVWGMYLARRDSTRSSARVLGLIAAVIAPLAAVALHPLAAPRPWLFWPLLLAWSAGAAFLSKRPADSYDSPSQSWIQAGIAGTTFLMGAAPLAAAGGSAALWLNALPVLLFWGATRLAPGQSRSNEAWAFVLLSPLYLGALFGIRLHLALAAAEALPPLGTYAPFLAAFVAVALGARPREETRAADPLSIAAVVLLAALLAGAAAGEAPAFFVTAALAAFTTWKLSRGGPLRRLRWIYPAYFFGYLAYQSCGQLVPGVLMTLLAAVKAQLGYTDEPLPYSFNAVYALLFVAGVGILAARLHSRADQRQAALAEALLRSTAVASVLFTLMALQGRDPRPGLYAIPLFSALGLGLGLWRGRSFLTLTGAGLSLLLVKPLVTQFGSPGASLLLATTALLLAVLSIPATRTLRWGLSSVVAAHCLLVVLLGWDGAPSGIQGAALAIAGAAALLVAFNLQHPLAVAIAAALAASACTRVMLAAAPELAPLSLCLTALGLALLSRRGAAVRLLWIPALAGTLLALPWQLLLQDRAEGPILLGWVLLVGAASCFLSGRAVPAMRLLGVLLASAALLPAMDPPTAWPWLLPLASAGAYAVLALASSCWTALRGRSAVSILFAACALAGAFIAAAVGSFSPPVLALAGLGALLSARALHPALSIPVATLYTLAAILNFNPSGQVLLLALACALSLVALIPELPFTRAVLFGGRTAVLPAALSAAAVVLVLCSLGTYRGFTLPLWNLVLLATLPLAWTRATRRPAFALSLFPILTAFALFLHAQYSLLWLLPLMGLLLTRAVHHLAPVRSLLLGRQPSPAQVDALQWFLLISLSIAASVAVLWPSAPNLLPIGIAAALLLGAGGSMPARLAVAALFAMSLPQARWPATGFLLALALAAHHLPAMLHQLLGARSSGSTLKVAVLCALATSALPWTLGEATPWGLLISAGTLALAALLLRQRWLLTPAVLLALVSPVTLHPLSISRPLEELPTVALGVLLTAALAALLRHPSLDSRVSALAQRLGPGFGGSPASPLWLGAAVGVLGFLAGDYFLPVPLHGQLVTAAVLILLVTPNSRQAGLASALLGASLAVWLPSPWAPLGVGLAGALLCLGGHLLATRFKVGEVFHHAGWLLSLVALTGLAHLDQPVTPLTVGALAASAWAVSLRRPALQPLAWLGSLAFAHLGLFYLGIRFSTGAPAATILPYLAASSALFAVLALYLASKDSRRPVGLGLALLSALEVSAGLVLLEVEAPREAWVAGLALAVLFFALLQRGFRQQDRAAAYLAQGVLALGYLVVRLHGMGASPSGADSLSALVAGAVFSGLFTWSRRQSGASAIFAGPFQWGAFLFPLAGLLAAPWSEPVPMALLLVGHAAHFGVLGRNQSLRRVGALLSALAFNASLVLTWRATGSAEPQYFVIPGGISLLVLVWIFRRELSALTQARLRAVAITAIYAAGAFKPLTFDAPASVLVCAFICVLGVGVGVALKIRSYVYLGTAFLVTTVVANLVRYGVRDPRLGALFLSALGLSVVAFMVLLSARREELLRRYRQAQQLLAEWEG